MIQDNNTIKKCNTSSSLQTQRNKHFKIFRAPSLFNLLKFRKEIKKFDTRNSRDFVTIGIKIQVSRNTHI